MSFDPFFVLHIQWGSGQIHRKNGGMEASHTLPYLTGEFNDYGYHSIPFRSIDHLAIG
ncbi:hypothetical protein ACT691_08490 [Vibrio metschnikovii]